MAPDNRLMPYTTSVVGLLRQHADEVAQVRQRPVGSSGYDRTLTSSPQGIHPEGNTSPKESGAEDSHPDPCNRARHYYCDARRFPVVAVTQDKEGTP